MKSASEYQIHTAIVAFLALQEKQSRLRFFHVPNGGGKLSFFMQKRLKKMGVRAGVPDICIIMADGKCLWVEVKSEKGTLSNLQRWWGNWLSMTTNHRWMMAKSVDEVKAAIDDMRPRR